MMALTRRQAAAHEDGAGRLLREGRARAYLLIALGEYMLDCEESCAWTQTIIDALALPGFEERATRQAIARTAAARWLVSGRSGQRVRWQLTPAGREYLTAARQRLFVPGPERDWDGSSLFCVLH
jgi:phenylacetic acid degradation operon negative regulatory protein